MAKKIKTILVSQPKPENDKSPYFDLARKYNLKIDFRPFIRVDGVETREFRKSRVNIGEHTAVIFTSKLAIDHYFRISEDLKCHISENTKYFCISESIAYYLQKYIVYRKRKIFFGNGFFSDLMTDIQKNKDEKYLLPLSNPHKPDIPNALEKAGIEYTKAILYQTVSDDLSDLKNVDYDALVFFSPVEIASLYQNFPDFEQKNTVIATFGSATASAAKNAKLKIDIEAPNPVSRSMVAAIENYICQSSKK
ncbi:MAG: uroporphyrinogen-III synthase [Bacteroidales bacterium]|nr:uroporphyrinogen-III synthase [Bacteroidales bacterium]